MDLFPVIDGTSFGFKNINVAGGVSLLQACIDVFGEFTAGYHILASSDTVAYVKSEYMSLFSLQLISEEC